MNTAQIGSEKQAVRLITLRYLLEQREDNPVLASIEKTKNYKKFSLKLTRALLNQIRHFFKNKNVKMAISAGDTAAALRFLKPITTFLEKEEFEKFYVWLARIGAYSAHDKIAIASKKIKRLEISTILARKIFNIIKERAEKIPEHLDKTTEKKIAKEIEKIKKAEKKITIAALLAALARLSLTRAVVITETEMAWIISRIELEIFKELGIKKKRFITAGDDRVCEICMPLHGKVFYTAEKIVSDIEGWLNLSGNFAASEEVLSPPLHVRCRCWLEAVIDDREL